MKMILASVLTTILIVAMTLGAMFILVQATEYVTSLESPL
jgi:heme/copper-type cytochrome/quinol oxidase subunit 3